MAMVEVGALRALLAMDAGEFIKGVQRGIAGLNSFERSLQSIQKTANTVGRNMSLYVTAPLMAIGTTSIGAARDFEKSMANVSTLVDTAKESMTNMSATVIDMGKRTPVALTDLSSALYDIRSAGISAADAMNVLEQSARLGVAGLGTTSEAADLVTSSLNAFGLKGYEAANVYDNIFKTVKNGKTTITGLAQGFGAVAGTMAASKIKLDEYLASVAALTTTGLPAAQAHTQLRAVVAGLTRETEESKKIFEAYGVKTFEELIVKSGGLVQALTLVKESVGGNKAQLLKLVGSTEALNAIIGLTGNQNKAFVDTLTDMRLGANAVDEAFKKQNETVAASHQRFANAVNTMAIAIGTALIPAVEAMTKWLTDLANAFSALDPATQTTIVVLGTMAAAIGPLMLVIGQLAGAIRLVLIPTITFLGEMFIAFAAATGPIGVFIAASALALAAWVAFKDQIMAVLGTVFDIFKSVFAGIIELINQLIGWVKHLLSYLPLVGSMFDDEVTPAINRATGATNSLQKSLASLAAFGGAFAAGVPMGASGDQPSTPTPAQPGQPTTPQAPQQQPGPLSQMATSLATSMAGLNNAITPVKVNLDDLGKKHTGASAAAKEHNTALREAKAILDEIKTPQEQLIEKQQKINELFGKGALTVEQYGKAMAQATAMNSKNMDALASTVSSNLSTIFGDTKAVAIATALINTYQGITRALATYPPPVSYAMAAIQAAAGFAQVANIRKQTSNGGGGGSAASATGSAAAAIPQQTQTLEVHGISANSLFTGNTVRAFAEKLRDYQADGGKVVFA